MSTQQYPNVQSGKQFKFLIDTYRDGLEELIREQIRQKDDILLNTLMDTIIKGINSNLTDCDIYANLYKTYHTLHKGPKTQILSKKRSNKRALEILHLLPQNTKFSTFLDVGCSEGSITADLAYELYIDPKNTYGCDVKDIKTDDFIFTQLNPAETSLPYDSNSMSLITILMVLHHIPHSDVTITELYRILKPGGYLIVREHDLNDYRLNVLIDVMHGLYSLVWYETPEDPTFCDTYFAKYRSLTDWENQLNNAGFITNYKPDIPSSKFWKNITRNRFIVFQKPISNKKLETKSYKDKKPCTKESNLKYLDDIPAPSLDESNIITKPIDIIKKDIPKPILEKTTYNPKEILYKHNICMLFPPPLCKEVRIDCIDNLKDVVSYNIMDKVIDWIYISMLEYLPKDRHINMIFDTNSGIGDGIISLLKYPNIKYVYGFESDNIKFKCLEHNIQLYNKNKSVSLINNKFIEWILSNPLSEYNNNIGIFMNLPLLSMGYKDTDRVDNIYYDVDMLSSDIGILDIQQILDLYFNNNNVSFVVIKLPNLFNMKLFDNKKYKFINMRYGTSKCVLSYYMFIRK